jgi:signal transduction histidine kinase
VLTTFVNNALKYTKEGSVSVTVSMTSVVGNVARIRIAVEDTGSGIDLETVELLRMSTLKFNSASDECVGGRL